MSVSSNARPRWYALKVHACCERQVEDLLRKHLWVGERRIEVETFLPIQRAYRNKSTGEYEYNLLVAEGIVFVRFTPTAAIIHAIRNTLPYVINFYLIAGTYQPASIPDHQIDRFRLMLNDSPHKVELTNSLRKGDKVEVIRGNLAGLTGTIYHDDNGSDYIYVELEILGQCARTRISKADTRLCDSIAARNQMLAFPPKYFALATRFQKLYTQISSVYLRQLSDPDLCLLARFYRLLLRSDRVLPALRSSIWAADKYCYQYFFADVYRELASRVKATRRKDERAPLLYALHCLCNQVNERAYTIKTNPRWVSESIASITAWHRNHRQANPHAPLNLHYLQLHLLDASDETAATLHAHIETHTPTPHHLNLLSQIPHQKKRLLPHMQTLHAELPNLPTHDLLLHLETLHNLHAHKAPRAKEYSLIKTALASRPLSFTRLLGETTLLLLDIEHQLAKPKSVIRLRTDF